MNVVSARKTTGWVLAVKIATLVTSVVLR